MGGRYYEDGCVRALGWDFHFWAREVVLDVVLIENVSGRALRVDQLLGQRSPETKLRSAVRQNPGARPSIPIGGASQTLEPGQRLLIPTKITFVPAKSFRADEMGDWQSSAQVHQRVGANGFRGNTNAHRTPDLKNYVYGPELTLGGLTIDGARVDLDKRSANFVDMALAYEGGSCPYLLSWNQAAGDWVNFGKVLHKANDKRLEYTETRTSQGFTRASVSRSANRRSPSSIRSSSWSRSRPARR